MCLTNIYLIIFLLKNQQVCFSSLDIKYTQYPRSPPVCVSRNRDPRWEIATSVGPFLAPGHGRESACGRTRPLVLLHSAPCPQSRGDGDDGGGAYGLWNGRDPCLDPCLLTWGRQTEWLCLGLCPGLMTECLEGFVIIALQRHILAALGTTTKRLLCAFCSVVQKLDSFIAEGETVRENEFWIVEISSTVPVKWSIMQKMCVCLWFHPPVSASV